MKTSISNKISETGSIKCFSFKSLFIVLLLLSSELSYSQTSINTDQLWFNGGGGISNRVNGANRNTLTWYGESNIWQLAVQVDQQTQGPDWVFRRSTSVGPVSSILYSPTNNARIVGEGSLLFNAGGLGLTSGATPGHMVITSSGNVGIGLQGPTERLHVNNGNILLNNGRFNYVMNFNNQPATFNIRAGAPNDRFWLGTQSNHLLTIGVNGRGSVNFLPDRCAIFYKSGNDDANINISAANRARYALFVEGGILSEDYMLGPRSSWADFVFEKEYRLTSLEEVEAYIVENQRLPEMPSASEVAEEGYNLHDMNVKLLQKVEELTLHSIRQNKEIEQLRQELKSYQSLSEKLEELEKRLAP